MSSPESPHAWLRTAGRILLGILATFVVLIVLLIVYIGTPYFAAHATKYLSQQSDRSIDLKDKVELHLWSSEPHVILKNVSVANTKWGSAPEMFHADRIEFSIKPLELLRLRIVLPRVLIDHPTLLLEKNKKGDANWNFSDNPQSAALKQPIPRHRSTVPIIHHLRVSDGVIKYNDAKKDIKTVLQISSIRGKTDTDDSIQLKGKGKYQNKPFSLEITGGSILELRQNKEPYPLTVKAIIGPTLIDAQGTVENPLKMEALDIKLHLKGDNAADLFPITGIALPPTPNYEVTGQLIHQKGEWDFREFAGRLGNSDLKGDITWHPDQKPPYFEGGFVSDNLDMADLKGFIGAHKKPRDEELVIPDTALDISRIMAMNADVTFRSKHVKAPNILEDFYMYIELKDGTLKLRPISFGIAEGTISANVMIEGKKQPPLTTLDVTFSHLALNDFFQPLANRFGKENVSSGLLGGKAKLSGSGKSLHQMLGTSNGTVGLGMEGGSLSKLLLELMGLDIFRSLGLILSGQDQPVAINCFVGDFKVASGTMEPRAFLLDTDVTTITGDGTVDLETEEVNLRLITHPHKASLLSARTPIKVTGTFKHMKTSISKMSLIARGGVATALGLIAPPVALLAFVEPGLGKNSNCAGYIHRMNVNTGAQTPKSAKPTFTKKK